MKDGSILEVTALFEDTLMSTTTLGRPRRAAWPLVAAGALGLLAAGLAVARGVSVAERNERAAAAFAGSSRMFRAERIGAGWDALVVIGLAGGLGLVLWGLLRRERPRDAYRLGGTGSDVPVAGLEAFPLVSRRGDDWVFSRPDGMTGDVVAAGVSGPLPEAVVLRRGLRIRGALGKNTFFIVADTASRPRIGPSLGALDERTLGSAGVSAALHAAVILLLLALPGERLGFGSDFVDEETRRASIRMRPSEDPKLQPGQGGHDTGGAAAMHGEAGTAGRPDATAAKGKLQIKHRQDGGVQVARRTPVHASTAGILVYFHTHEEAFESIVADATFSNGFDDRDVLAWNGPGAGDAVGWGVGPGGVGPGGGGLDPHTIGPGRYRTIPGGPGGPGNYPFGPGGPILGPRKPRPVFTIGHVVEPPEGLDPNVIRRYLRQRTSEITYCYEKELVTRPELAGMVTARFAIDQNGRVLKAEAGGLGEPVDGCIAEVLRTIKFPASQNVYAITYPFTFRAAGM